MKHDREEARRKRVVIIFSALIVFFMVASIFGYVMIDASQQSNDLTYNKYTFTQTNTGFRVKYNSTYMDFSYYPSDLERINMSTDIYIRLTNAKGIVYLFNPNESIDNLQYSDYARFDMSNQLKIPMGFAITSASSQYTGLAVMSCQNSTADVPFIMLNISSDDDFVLDSRYANCIVMNAKLKDIVAMKDRLVYRLLGIMPN